MRPATEGSELPALVKCFELHKRAYLNSLELTKEYAFEAALANKRKFSFTVIGKAVTLARLQRTMERTGMFLVRAIGMTTRMRASNLPLSDFAKHDSFFGSYDRAFNADSWGGETAQWF